MGADQECVAGGKGVDLVQASAGKVEEDTPEDDPCNPAVGAGEEVEGRWGKCAVGGVGSQAGAEVHWVRAVKPSCRHPPHRCIYIV